MGAVSNYRRSSGAVAAAVVPLPPLRTLDVDDQDFTFFTYTGTWYYYRGPDWPGGVKNNTGTSRAAVVPTETTPLVDTPVLRFRGSPEEGIDFYGAGEDDGKASFYIRALDSATNTGWVAFGPPLGSYCYRYEWNPNVAEDSRPENVKNYANSFRGQNIYYRLGDPGLIQVRGFPAGRYQFRLQKDANTTDPNSNGNRATYFDGVTVYTRA
jgi:hypothetical protein